MTTPAYCAWRRLCAMNWLVITFILVMLLLVTALYVAAEFAAASSRRSRLAQMAGEGDRLAELMLPILEKPAALDTYIAACQLGITTASLVLGFWGQAALTGWFESWLGQVGVVQRLGAGSVAATVVLLFLTSLQVLLGELVPKNVGIRYPEKLATLTVLPMRWSMLLFRPLIWLFNGSARLILRLMGLKPAAEHAHIHGPDEILLLVKESGAGGLIDYEERRLIENTLQLGRQPVRQVMVPRTQMLAAAVDEPVSNLLALLANSPFSRLPLYEDTIDKIVGVVHLKDLLCLCALPGDKILSAVMKQPCFVPATLGGDEVFARLQRTHQHMAIVVDEFGGTAGLVTIEDLIEEIFGDIQDEFDKDAPVLHRLDEQRVLVRGDLAIADANDLLGFDLPDDDATTIAGLILSETGHVPTVGEVVNLGELSLRVEKMERNRVVAVVLERVQAAGETEVGA